MEGLFSGITIVKHKSNIEIFENNIFNIILNRFSWQCPHCSHVNIQFNSINTCVHMKLSQETPLLNAIKLFVISCSHKQPLPLPPQPPTPKKISTGIPGMLSLSRKVNKWEMLNSGLIHPFILHFFYQNSFDSVTGHGDYNLSLTGAEHSYKSYLKYINFVLIVNVRFRMVSN